MATAGYVLSLIFVITAAVHAVTIFGVLVQTKTAPFSVQRTVLVLFLERGGSGSHPLERLCLSEEVATS